MNKPLETNLSDIAQKVLDLAKRGGADEAEVFIERSSSTTVFVKDQAIENLTAKDTSGLGLRVLSGSALGFGSSNRFNQASIEKLVMDTIACAKGSSPDEFNCFAESKAPAEIDLQIFDKNVQSAPLDDKIKRGLLLESSARAFDRRIKRTAYIVYGDGVSTTGVFNTRGVAYQFSASSSQGVSWVAALDGKDTESGLAEDASTNYSKLDCEAIGREAAQKAVALLGGEKVQSGKMPVILDGRTVGEFLDFFSRLISADSVQKGKSMLAGKLGQKIASSNISIFDDGLLIGGLQSAPVDGIGYPQQKTVVIENGELKTFVYDCYSGKKGNMPSTGNARRESYRSRPIVGTTNFYIERGETGREDLLAEMGKGILITSIRGLFAGLDVATGDFSIPAQGMAIQSGKADHPVKDFQISGNLFKMLTDVLLVGDELVWSNAGRYGAPDILVKELSIAGS